MDRRELLGVLGATAASLAAVTGGKVLAQEHEKEEHKDDVHEKCADACADCMQECEEGFHHCSKQVGAGKSNYAKAMHLCVDCAEVCGTASKLCARMSPMMVPACHACAECCAQCIAECEKLNDPEMKEVVAALHKCEQSCREMVKMMGGHEHQGQAH